MSHGVPILPRGRPSYVKEFGVVRHRTDGLAAGDEKPEQIDVEHPVKGFVIDVLQRPELEHRCVVDQYIQLAEPPDGF